MTTQIKTFKEGTLDNTINEFLQEHGGVIKNYSPVVIEYELKEEIPLFEYTLNKLTFGSKYIGYSNFVGGLNVYYWSREYCNRYSAIEANQIIMSNENIIFTNEYDNLIVRIDKDLNVYMNELDELDDFDQETHFLSLNNRTYNKDKYEILSLDIAGSKCDEELHVAYYRHFEIGHETYDFDQVKRYIKKFCEYNSNEWVPFKVEQNEYYSKQTSESKKISATDNHANKITGGLKDIAIANSHVRTIKQQDKKKKSNTIS